MTVLGNPVEVSLENILFATDFSASAETAKSMCRRSQSDTVHGFASCM